MQHHLEGAIYHSDAYVVEHDNILTGAGPAAARLFACTIARHFVADATIVDRVENDMLFEGYDASVNRLLKF